MRYTLIPVVLLGFVWPAFAQQPSASTDLDLLLELLGQGGIVNNQPLRGRLEDRWRENSYYMQNKFISQTTREKADLEKLGRSSTREVAEAVRRLKPAIAMREQAVALEKESKALIAKVRQEQGPTAAEYSAVATMIFNDLDTADLDELVIHGHITRANADEYWSQRGQLNATFWQKFGQSFWAAARIEQLTNWKVRPLRHGADVLKDDVVAELLLPLVRARAGKQHPTPPLQMKVGVLNAGYALTGGTYQGVQLNVRSLVEQELTRVTIQVELRTPQGWRYATLYIPRLPAMGGGTFDHLALSYQYLHDAPKDARAKSVGITPQNLTVRYSVWCDQLRSDGLTPEVTSSQEEFYNDMRLLALLPNMSYVSGPGIVRDLNPAYKPPYNPYKPHPAPFFEHYEPAGRYELVFRKLTPVGTDYDVELDLVDQRLDGKAVRYRGRLTLPAIKGDTSDKRLALKVSNGSEEILLELEDSSDGASWRTGRGPGWNRAFSAWLPPIPGSPEALRRERLRAAMTLALDRKYDEAQAAYDQIAADFPIPGIPIKPSTVVKQIKENHAKEDEERKAQEAAANKPAETRRPPVASRPQPNRSSSRPEPRPARPTQQERPAPETNPRVAPPSQDVSPTRVVVDDVEYVYQGAVRSGNSLVVTVLATSREGDRDGPRGAMTLVDANGKRFTGQPTGGRRSQAELKEGKPVRLSWEFGGRSFGGGTLPLPAIGKGDQFSRISIGGGRSAIEFRDVPAVVSK